MTDVCRLPLWTSVGGYDIIIEYEDIDSLVLAMRTSPILLRFRRKHFTATYKLPAIPRYTVDEAPMPTGDSQLIAWTSPGKKLDGSVDSVWARWRRRIRHCEWRPSGRRNPTCCLRLSHLYHDGIPMLTWRISHNMSIQIRVVARFWVNLWRYSSHFRRTPLTKFECPCVTADRWRSCSCRDIALWARYCSAMEIAGAFTLLRFAEVINQW